MTAPPASTASNRKNDAQVAESISQVIGETLKSFSNKPEDLIRLGMGLGASLGAQGFLNLGGEQETAEVESTCEDEKEEAVALEEALLECDENISIDDVTIKSCSSEETELDGAVIENNIVPFSNFHPSPQGSGLLDVIAATRVGAKRVKYLSYTFSLNLPISRNVDPLKPRSTAEEWKESEYNPWSDGREPTSSSFVRSVAHETRNWPKSKRTEGSASNGSAEFAKICTLCRHGKYRELEDTLNDPSWSLPIDYCDDAGNTLLMIACQNGNKRIAKLCLRRGSQINNQNLNGNSCLHFAFGYGFSDLGEYLISKGADDSLQNANYLTCYEGLDMDEL